MSLLKKVTAAAAASAIALSLASCGKDTTWGADIDGTRLRAGILIYFQSEALADAYGYMGENDTNVLDITIEGQPARDWINNKAIEDMRKYVAVENKFSELGLSFQNKEDELAKINLQQWWEYIGAYYEAMGIGEQSYMDAGLNDTKKSALFNYYYGEGGEKAASEDEIKSYLEDNYARIRYIEMPLKDGEGNILKSDEKADVLKMAEDYLERAKNGESFDVLSKEYDEYSASISGSGSEETETTAIELFGSEDSAVSEEASVAAGPNYGTVITKVSVLPSASVVEKVFSGEMTDNSYAIVEEYEVCYVVYRMGLYDDERFIENNSNTARHALKDEEFEQMIDSWVASQNAVINNDAIDRYTIDKLAAY